MTHLSQQHAIKQIDAKQLKSDWRLWPVGGKLVSFEEAKTAGSPLDRDFIDLVIEKSSVASEFRQLIVAISDPATAAALLPADPAQGQDGSFVTSPVEQDLAQVQGLSLKRWRSAEQQVMSLLAAQRWAVEDVSRQNVGYDIKGRTPDGEEIFIEVKSIDHPGQAFTLTSNEEVVARQMGAKYQLAIVHQSDSFLEVAFIPDPIHNVKLIRQCRQWAWECAEYSFNPQRFPLE